jgi:hypothetical protein
MGIEEAGVRLVAELIEAVRID